MPLILRNGLMSEAPKRKYASPYSVFMDKRLHELTKKYPEKTRKEV